MALCGHFTPPMIECLQRLRSDVENGREDIYGGTGESAGGVGKMDPKSADGQWRKDLQQRSHRSAIGSLEVAEFC